MKSKRFAHSKFLAISLLGLIVFNCTALAGLGERLGIVKGEEDNELLTWAALYLLTKKTVTTDSIATNCASGSVVNNGLGLGVESSSLSTCWSCVTNNASGLPDWIENNFKCMTITVNGANYDFAMSGANGNGKPPHKSGYYTSVSSCQESYPSGNSANPNAIGGQTVTFSVAGTPNETSSASSLGIAGVSVNGAALYNDAAAPGDSLTTELATMDQGYGHPTNTSQYHYHTEPCKITRNDSSLLGIAKDGYAIYGKFDTDGTLPSLDSSNFHAGSTGIDGNTKGHYHVERSTGTGLLIRTNHHGT